MSALVVNLFAGPCAGKSTLAAGVFYNLKKAGFNCELVTEFAKELTWENRTLALDNQIYILGKQYHRFYRVLDQVDVIITDTSFLYGCIYCPPQYFPSFTPLVLEIFNSMDNLNFWIERKVKYNPSGRRQTEQEALDVEDRIQNWLKTLAVTHKSVPGNDKGMKTIVDDVCLELERKNNV